RLGHDRRRCLRDGAALAQEAHVLDPAVVAHLEPDVHLVAAEGIEPLGLAGGAGHLAEVAGRAVVVEDDGLVELAHRGHQANTSRTRPSPRTSASTSARLLYMPSEARAVAGTPRRCISGWAQWWPARMQTPSLSRMVPMSCGWMPSITNEITDARSAAVPTRRRPAISPSRSVA